MPDIDLAITELHAAYARGGDPVEIVDAIYDRIAAVNDPGIFITLCDRAHVRAAAAALGPYDPTRPLWGVPFAVKDNIDVAGLPTTAGCREFAYTPSASASAVSRCLDAGALLIGKTNLDQFATGLVGVRTPYPVPRNAYDPTIVPGGSSSGSAVAVAQRLVSFALGTDTAGSGRVPAALNNLVGLKPSLGAISSRGLVPACRTLDTISVFAPSVEDAWRAYEIVAGGDPDDAFSRPIALGPLGPPPPQLRIGVPRAEDFDFFGDHAAAKAWRDAVDRLKASGATIVDVDMRPFQAAAQLLYHGPWVAERAAATRAFFASHRDDALPVTRTIIESAQRFSAVDAFEGWYKLVRYRHEIAPVMASLDALCVPSLPRIPTVAEAADDPIGHNTRLGLWTNFVNLLDLAAIAVPGPFRDDARPAGVTFIGARGRDTELAAIGRAFHRGLDAAPTAEAVPASRTDAPTEPPDLIEIAVVGAHLSGMPLNGELTREGAVFRRAVSTEPCYGFYALAGGPPARPGLIRVKPGCGHAIETEVWALPAASFGRFVASIPAPLAIGTVRLADGTRPKGFVAESIAIDDARDISALKGWRAFVRAGQRDPVEPTA